MPDGAIPDKVRRFLFDHVDSVEQIEVLLFLWHGKESDHTAQDVYASLRTNVDSVRKRLDGLVALGLASASDGEPKRYRYCAQSAADDELMAGLAEAYRVRRYTVLELIFSPMKRARSLADAFRLVQPKKGDDGG